MKTLSNVPLNWTSLGGTVSLLKLYEEEKFPQVCILRVSNSDYLKFSQDPKGFMNFVNDHNVFSKDIIEAGPWVSLSSAGETKPCDWVLTLIHGKASTMLVSALPQLIQDEPRKK